MPPPVQNVGVAQAIQGLFLAAAAVPGEPQHARTPLHASHPGYTVVSIPAHPACLHVTGTFSLIAPLPFRCTAGWLAGRMRKDSILRMLALVQLAAIATTSWVLYEDSWEPDRKFRVLCIALALWGVAQVGAAFG